ncbi:panthothenate kinase, acetyl-CoA regulated [Anaerolinea thermolimosa]|nr:panthothenate kinase, acetyl-CoA regulated [Anaerolinea thermolimosa]
MLAAIDLGITNIDIVFHQGDTYGHVRLPANGQPVERQMEAALNALQAQGCQPAKIAVTGGQYRRLATRFDAVEIVGVSEVQAIGLGGLALAGVERALVVSAGSGTAMVAARGRDCTHITGIAVGGGTLQGLGRLLVGTADAPEIDRLALAGDPNRADLTLVEAVGGTVGRLPPDANAVNFGRLARQPLELSQPDLAAALVRLVGQVIAVVAINAARAEGLEPIVVIGHLVDLPSLRRVLNEVAGYYQATIYVPERPGMGTALGALLWAEGL